MRVTDRMIVNHTVDQLGRGRNRLGELQVQVATGRRLLRPSDDPADVERALALTSELRTVENQVENLNTTRDWLSTTDQALARFRDLMITARNLALRAANETNSPNELAGMAGQAGEMLENALAVANARMGDYYVFSGQKIDVKPFTRDGDTVVYNGDNQVIEHMVEIGQTMPINITGVEGRNGGLLNALNELNLLREALADGNRAGIQRFLERTQEIDEDLAAGQSTVGARLQRIDTSMERLQRRAVELKSMISRLVDANLAETVSEMTAEQRAYQMTLAASGRMLPRSLLDYLR